MSNIEYIRVPSSKLEELKLKKQQLKKLLETALTLRPQIVAEERDERTEEELEDHDRWVNEIKQQLKDIDKLL